MNLTLELVLVPVADTDRAKTFYTEQLGFVADHDQRVNDELRFVQLTPPGSACSIAVGDGISDMTPGTMRGLQLVVADIEAIKAEFAERGFDAGDVHDLAWGRFLFFDDPDGNGWAIQQLPQR